MVAADGETCSPFPLRDAGGLIRATRRDAFRESVRRATEEGPDVDGVAAPTDSAEVR